MLQLKKKNVVTYALGNVLAKVEPSKVVQVCSTILRLLFIRTTFQILYNKYCFSNKIILKGIFNDGL